MTYLDLDTFLPQEWATTGDPDQGSCCNVYTWSQNRKAGTLYFHPNICKEEKSALQTRLWTFSSQRTASCPKQSFDGLPHTQFRQPLLCICHAEADQRPHSSKSCYLVLCAWPTGPLIKDSLLHLMTMTPVSGNRSSPTEDMPAFLESGCQLAALSWKSWLRFFWCIFSD